jgi:hypothetical protein
MHCWAAMQSNHQLTSCKACDVCDAGSFRSGCGGQSPGSCQACGVGKYQPLRAFVTACTACEACPPGFERVDCGGTSAGSCRGILCDALPAPAFATVSFSNSERRYPTVASFE